MKHIWQEKISNMRQMHIGFLSALGLLLSMATSSFAIPVLQLYIEGATYDTTTQSWMTGAHSFKLWVVADVKSKGTIFDVKLTAAYNTSETGTITLTLTTATVGLLPLPGDPSTPSTPVFEFTSLDGAVPKMGDGKSLPSHGEYGFGITFKQWGLGDFTLKDSPIGDFNGTSSFPTSFPSTGQINAYEVAVTGYTQVHFDSFDHVLAEQTGKFKQQTEKFDSLFAPFSHDAGSHQVSEPSATLLLGLALMFGAGFRLLQRYRRR